MVFMYHLGSSENDATFNLLSPKELEWIETEYKIVKDVETFEEIPEKEYGDMAKRLVDNLYSASTSCMEYNERPETP